MLGHAQEVTQIKEQVDTKAANFPQFGLSGHVRAVWTMEEGLAGCSALLDTEAPAGAACSGLRQGAWLMPVRAQ